MTESQAAELAAYWVQFSPSHHDRSRSEGSALIAERRQLICDRVPGADAWTLLPSSDTEELAILDGGVLHRLAVTEVEANITRSEVSRSTCEFEASDMQAEVNGSATRVRRWRFRLPPDDLRLEVEDEVDEPLMSPTTRFARTLAHRLGYVESGRL